MLKLNLKIMASLKLSEIFVRNSLDKSKFTFELLNHILRDEFDGELRRPSHGIALCNKFLKFERNVGRV